MFLCQWNTKSDGRKNLLEEQFSNIKTTPIKKLTPSPSLVWVEGEMARNKKHSPSSFFKFLWVFYSSFSHKIFKLFGKLSLQNSLVGSSDANCF